MAKTLSDLQAEREQLKADQAKADFETALETTCDKTALVSAAVEVRRLLLRMVENLPAMMAEVIEQEHDETRVHYLLSDLIHTLLSGLGSEVEDACAALPQFGTSFKRGSKPRDLLTVSQWADRHRWVKSGTNAPGKWNTALTPYLREIMDSLSEHSPVRTVVFMKSSGVGGTEVMYNWLGYTMQHLQNKDMLVVLPTLELRDRSFNPRLSKMLDETEVLGEIVTTASRNKANRGDLLEYGARARVIKAGANSPDSLRSDHLPYVICDEVDAFPWDVGGEGDPMTLIENRQRTYSRAKTYLVSTPTTENASRIAQKYARSDRRRYHMACPHCGEYQTLEWGGRDTPYGIKWRLAPGDENIITDAWYVCRHCAAVIEEGSKTEMLLGGRWIAERPNIKLVRGYHINALYAPIGLGLSWKKVAQKWLDSQNDSSELKAYINTYLGEVYREDGISIENLSLISRLEEYANPPILARTAGVDVQKDRLEITIIGWGLDEEAWVLDHLIIPGDTAQPHVWQELSEQLTGLVEFAAIDSGYNTSMVYAFVEKRRWCAAIKGVTGMGRPLVEDEKKRRQRLRVKRKKGIPTEPIGVDQGKALIYSRLNLQNPCAGYIHFPREPAFDDEYFAQLAAEKLVTKVKGTRPIQQWVQTRPRNEALDCMLYALVALRLSGIDLKNLVIKPPITEKIITHQQKPRSTSSIAKSDWSSRL